MPRVHINVQDIDDAEELEQQEDWERMVGLRVADERRAAQAGSAEGQWLRRLARGSGESRDRRRADRRKTVRRGGRRV